MDIEAIISNSTEHRDPSKKCSFVSVAYLHGDFDTYVDDAVRFDGASRLDCSCADPSAVVSELPWCNACSAADAESSECCDMDEMARSSSSCETVLMRSFDTLTSSFLDVYARSGKCPFASVVS